MPLPKPSEKGLAMVKRELLNIPNEKTRRIAEQHVGEILCRERETISDSKER